MPLSCLTYPVFCTCFWNGLWDLLFTMIKLIFNFSTPFFFNKLNWLRCSKLINTCFNNKSELGEQQVTRCLVKCRKEASVSGVRWSLLHRCSMCEMTRNPRHCNMCCWTVLQDSTREQMKPSSFELWTRKCHGYVLWFYECLLLFLGD